MDFEKKVKELHQLKLNLNDMIQNMMEITEKLEQLQNNKKDDDCKLAPVMSGLKDVILKCNSSGYWNPCKAFLEDKLKKNSTVYCELKRASDDFGIFPVNCALLGCKSMIAILLANGLPINGICANVIRSTEYLDCKGTLTADKEYSYNEYGLLHCAVENRHADLVEFLLCKEADTEARQCNGKTPLHLAAEEGYLDIIKLLVENSCDINAKDINLKTPLHIAAQKGHKSVVEYLVKSGCSKNIRDCNCKTPMDVAENFKIKSILQKQ